MNSFNDRSVGPTTGSAALYVRNYGEQLLDFHDTAFFTVSRPANKACERWPVERRAPHRGLAVFRSVRREPLAASQAATLGASCPLWAAEVWRTTVRRRFGRGLRWSP